MLVTDFIEEIKRLGIRTLAGVPDSALGPFCDYINGEGNSEFTHYVPANEGAAIGIAIGEYLSSGRPACVYMQNSGLGNAVNPLTSLASEEVYGIPMLLIIGYRGQAGTKDEPQHKFMGKITEPLLELLDIEHIVLKNEMTDSEIAEAFKIASSALDVGHQFAFVLERDFLQTRSDHSYSNSNTMLREEAISAVISNLESSDIVVSTTGKISREAYEQSEIINNSHNQIFLTVGGMGHASMIALGIAGNANDKRVYCIDGDGAALMHMGSLAFIANKAPGNLIHICLNNGAHESVGGMPTGCPDIRLSAIARESGYKRVYNVSTRQELEQVLEAAKSDRELTFIEVNVALGSRADLGRPRETAAENKENFMKYHGVI